MAPLFPKLIEETKECAENEEYLEAYGVRIQPGFVVFRHAFDGRTYKQKITIQNVGSTKVCVRITKPTSYAYKIKCCNGQNISPGLRLVREMTCVYNHSSASYCTLGIYINENRIDYKIYVEECAPVITFVPSLIDFGMVDSDVTTASQLLEIRNSGSKHTRFYVDTKSTFYKLMADPCKGFVEPRSSVNVHLKLLSATIGRINDGLWVKCDKPYIIPLRGEIIKPTFETIYRSLSSPVTVIDFPPTYVGATSIETAFVRNYSASQGIFCVMGDVNGKITYLRTCRDLADDYKNFDVTPKEGSCQSKELMVFNFGFKPVKPKRGEGLKPFYFCVIQIHRMKCKLLTSTTYPDELFVVEEKTQSETYSSSSSIALESIKVAETATISLYSNSMEFEDQPTPTRKCDYITFYLHGIAEEPSVTVIPDELNISDTMTVGERATRVLEFKNRSDKLPIIIAYRKTVYIEVSKDNFTIAASKSVEISVSIAPQNIGAFRSRLRFDLMYCDQSKKEIEPKVIGTISLPISFVAKVDRKTPPPEINDGITPNYIREVGKFCQDVRFDSKVKKPKKATLAKLDGSKKASSALIAFPNDLRRSTRPWRGDIKVKTIFTKTPRYIPPLDPDYEMTVFDKKMKLHTINYYTNYTRKGNEKLLALSCGNEKTAVEYGMPHANIICKYGCYRCTIVNKLKEKIPHFIPLTPRGINNILIDPMILKTGPIATHSKTECKLLIKNKNEFDIRLYFRPEKPNLLFPEGNRRIVKKYSEEVVTVVYISSLSGYYTTSLDIIVNECGVFVVNIEADTRSHHLQVDTDYLEFKDEYTRYLEIFNPLNSNTSFKWMIEGKNFQIEPLYGEIRAHSKLRCEVMYVANREGPDVVQLDLTVADKIIHNVKLMVGLISMRQYFTVEELIFDDIPLNISVTKLTLLTNDSSYPRSFSLMPSDVLDFVSVHPKEGIVYGNSYSIISVTLKVPSCVQFATKLKFKITGTGILELPLRGNVVYPEVLIIPKIFKFQKIPSSTIGSLKFNVTNRSNAMASVRFDLSMYGEYKITETKNYWSTEFLKDLTLAKQQSKELFIHFIPKAEACDQFYLPVVINDILGPFTAKSLTNNASAYLSDCLVDCRMVELPFKIETIRVLSYSIAPKLIFSKLTIRLNFKVAPYSYKNSHNLKISYNGKEDEWVCIRTNQLTPPFALSQKGGQDIINYANSTVCKLQPHGEIILNISFNPDRFGNYEATIPVHIKSDTSTQPHNVIRVFGTFQSPTITSRNIINYYKPGPLLVVNMGLIEFHFDNHFEYCKVKCTSDIYGFKTEIVDDLYHQVNRRVVTMKVTYTTDRCISSLCTFSMYCSCGVSRCITVAICRENCFLTNYAEVYMYIKDQNYNMELKRTDSTLSVSRTSLMSILDPPRSVKEEYDMDAFFIEYPLFPVEDSDLNNFMTTCVKTVESWMYTQVFFAGNYYKIPTGMAHVVFDSSKVQPPFLKLLIRLGGSQMEDYFTVGEAPTEDIDRAKYLYDIYDEILKLLVDLGALLACVRPELLLHFNYYQIYIQLQKGKNQDPPKIFISNEEEYYRLSKQCWLDVLLQTYKVMVLYRLMFCEKKVYKAVDTTSSAHERYVNSVKNIAKNHHLFSNTELLLIDWLEFHYNDARKIYWPQLDYREIVFFGDNMHDGFVYAAVTLSYCPYFEDHFKRMYDGPKSREELLHNCILVIQAWSILNISLVLSAMDLVTSHPLRTLFIMAYLYQVLPNMHPSHTIAFHVGLSQRLRKSLRIRNRNDFVVAYKAILYGNDGKTFEVDQELYVIGPKSSRKIHVDYWARFIKSSRCTLILSGECKGYHYATSKVINLIGTPDVQYVSDTIDACSVVYKLEKVTLKVTSPYRCAAQYKLQFSSSALNEMKEVSELAFIEGLPQYSLSRLFLAKDEIDFDENGEAQLEFYIILVTTRVIPLWYFFRNAEVGDFCVKIVTKQKPFCAQEKLKAYFQTEKELDGWSQQMFVDLPAQNRLLWNGLSEAFLKISEDEHKYWKKHSRSIVGMHILLKLMEACKVPFDLKLCRSTRYAVNVPKNCALKFPTFIEINDQCSLDFVKVPVGLRRDRVMPQSVSIALVSPDLLEVRNYEIHLPIDGTNDTTPSLKS